VPFVTGWMGENHFAAETMALYGFIMLMAAFAYFFLQNSIIRSQGEGSILKHAVGNDLKGKLSPVLYIIGIAMAWVNVWISGAMFVLVAIIWLVPDKRIEKILKNEGE